MYSDFDIALKTVRNETGITNRDAVISVWLEESKGTKNGADEYRPLLVCAIALHTNKSDQTLTSAPEGVKFRQSSDSVNLEPVIRGYLRTQESLDAAIADIPLGWDCAKWLDSLYGSSEPGETVSSGTIPSALGAMVF